MKNIFRRSAVLLLALVLLLNCAPMALADGPEDLSTETAGEQTTEPTPEPTAEPTAEPTPAATSEPEPEATEAPAGGQFTVPTEQPQEPADEDMKEEPSAPQVSEPAPSGEQLLDAASPSAPEDKNEQDNGIVPLATDADGRLELSVSHYPDWSYYEVGQTLTFTVKVTNVRPAASLQEIEITVDGIDLGQIDKVSVSRSDPEYSVGQLGLVSGTDGWQFACQGSDTPASRGLHENETLTIKFDYALTSKELGEHSVSFTAKSGTDTLVSVTKDISVQKKILNVVITGDVRAPWVYDKAVHSLEGFTYLVNDGTADKSLVEVTYIPGGTPRVANTEAGSYPMGLSEDLFDVKVTDEESYQLGKVTVNDTVLTIKKRPITVELEQDHVVYAGAGMVMNVHVKNIIGKVSEDSHLNIILGNTQAECDTSKVGETPYLGGTWAYGIFDKDLQKQVLNDYDITLIGTFYISERPFDISYQRSFDPWVPPSEYLDQFPWVETQTVLPGTEYTVPGPYDPIRLDNGDMWVFDGWMDANGNVVNGQKMTLGNDHVTYRGTWRLYAADTDWIQVEITSDKDVAHVGDVIKFTINVINTQRYQWGVSYGGQNHLYGVVVRDPLMTPETASLGMVEVTQAAHNKTYTFEYTVTEEDLERGEIVSPVEVTGYHDYHDWYTIGVRYVKADASCTVKVEPEYDWGKGTWTWSADGASATLKVPRVDGKDPALTRTVLTSMAETKATCEEAGERTYSAQITVHGHPYNASKTVEIPALGHNWDVTGRVKMPALSDRSVTVYCLNDLTHTCTAPLKETKNESASQEPDCGNEKDGVTVYDRTFTVDGKEYPLDQVKVTVPWSHTWGAWKDVSETQSGTTFTRECTVCGKEDEPVDHRHDWHLPDPEPHGAANENVKWELGPTEYGVTVLHVYCSDEECKYHNGMDVPIDASQLHYETEHTIDPTCEKAGETVYEVTLTMPGLGSQDVSETYYSDPVVLPATGHQWGDAEFDFAQEEGAPYDANEKCTITLHCAHCGETRTVEVTVIGAEKTAPGCDTAGVMVVTAETVYEGQTYTSQPQTRTTPAAGHAYSTATVQWAADHASAVVTLVCSKDGHTMDVTVTDITKAVTEPTCDAQGTATYTLDLTKAIPANVKYTGNTVFSDAVPIPATGHDWDVEGETFGLKPGVDGDYTTLTIFCKTDTSHTQTVYTDLKEVDREDPTCAKEGSRTYRMTYEFEGETHEVENTETYTIPSTPHTWGEWEQVRTTARAAGEEVWQRECQVCHLTERTSHQHAFYFTDNYRWNVVNGKPLSFTVAAACQDPSCDTTETLAYTDDDIQIDQERSKAPTCDTEGLTVYTVTARIDDQTKTFTYTQSVPALGHKWELVKEDCGLSADYSKYTFVFKCSVCGDTTDKTVPTDAEVLTPATCEEPGLLYYRADLEMDGKPYSFADTKPVPALNHAWDPAGAVEAPLLETKDDFITVTIFCANDHSHTQTVYATRTLAEDESTAATCTTPGKEVYELSYTFDGKEYDLPQTAEYTIPALGHLRDEHGTCTRCGDKLSDGAYTWDLPDPNVPGDSSRIKWSQPSAGGKPTLTLTVYRTDSSGNTVKEEIVITDVTADPHPDCEKVGSTDYTAKVELGGKSETYTTSINDLPPIGHDWTFDEEKDVVWSDDLTHATFTLRCKNDWHEGEAETQTVVVGPPTETPATCEKGGTLVYTATAQLGGATVTARKTVTGKPPLGHDWTYTATWSKDHSTVTFDFTCSRDKSHTDKVTVNAKRETVTAADCTATGLDYVSASYEKDGLTATASQDVVTSALGHDYKDGVCTRCGAKDTNYKASTDTAPDTGDGTDPLTWTALLLACAGALTAVLRRRARQTARKHN